MVNFGPLNPISRVTQLLKLSRPLRPELNPKQVRMMLESAKGEGQAWKAGDFNAAEMWADKRNPLMELLYLSQGKGRKDKVVLKHNRDIDDMIDKLVEHFRLG